MTNELKPAQEILTNAIRHIRRTQLNCRTWTLPVADEKAIEILIDARFWAGQSPEFDRINTTGKFAHPVSEPCCEGKQFHSSNCPNVR